MQITSHPPVLIDALFPKEWVQTRVQQLTLDAALMVGFAWFVALSAQIAVRLPWTTVPITGQTFAVLVAGGALGARRGAGSLIIYMLMGMAAIPVFAPGPSAFALDGTWGVHFIFPWLGTASLPWSISSGPYPLSPPFSPAIIWAAAVRGVTPRKRRVRWILRPFTHRTAFLGSVTRVLSPLA